MPSRERDFEAEREADRRWSGWDVEDYDEAEIRPEPDDDGPVLAPGDDLFGRKHLAPPPRGPMARLWDALKTLAGR